MSSVRLVSPIWSRILLATCLLQLSIDFNSVVYLFLWPVNHSCAREQTDGNNQSIGDNSKTFNDSHNKPIEFDAIQRELVNASPDDPHTAAKALVMGLDFDDLSRCYEHPSQYNNQTQELMVNKEGLQSCKYGLLFEEPGLSLVGHFQLACHRKWLKVLLPVASGLGYFMGILIQGLINKSKKVIDKNKLEQQSYKRHLFWLSVQTLASGGAILCSLIAHQSFKKQDTKSIGTPDLYILIPISVSLRFLVISGNISNFIPTNWILESNMNEHEHQRKYHVTMVSQREHHWSVRTLLIMHLLVSAIYPPLALRVFSNWIQMNSYLNLSGGVLFSTFTVIWFINEFDVFPSKVNVELKQRDKQVEQQDNLVTEIIREKNLNFQDRQPTVCEFCIPNELSIVGCLDSAGRNSDQMFQIYDVATPAEEFDGCTSQVPREIQLDVESPPKVPQLTSNPYNSTTIPTKLFGSKGYANDAYFNRNLVDVRGRQMRHNFGLANRNLSSWWVVGQLWLLLFACLLNYFMLQMLPNHRLLHSESIASRNLRKLAHHLARKYSGNTSTTIAPFLFDQRGTAGKDGRINKAANVTNDSIDQAIISSEHYQRYEYLIGPPAEVSKNPTSKPFDYSDLNLSAELLQRLKSSCNPLRLLFDTAHLNGWPILLVVVLLHQRRISNISQVYFKLNRLFSLVKIGSRMLFGQWLVIGLFKSQNHLVEWDWLASLVVVVSRFSAALMLYNYLETILKLGRKLGPNIKLIEYARGASATCLALMLASLAPLMEKWDLVVVPVVLLANNLLAYMLAKSLKKRFKLFLCPMIFEDDKH